MAERPAAKAFPMLPNFSSLRVARTGMTADGSVDDASDEAGPAPGEVATLHDQYLETSDFFVAVLQQIDDGSDSLKRVCKAVKSWCATDKGRWDTCNDEDTDKEWVKLTEKVFTKHGLPQDVEENPPLPYPNFVSLCNMDPVKRLVRIGRRCYWANQQRLVLEAEKEGDSWTEQESELKFQALKALIAEPEASNETSDDFPGLAAWTTERDDQADVALALTVLAKEFGQDAAEFVQENCRQCIIQQIARLENANSTTPRSQVARMRMQLARLTSWIFTQITLSDLVDPLYQYGGALCRELYGLVDVLSYALENVADVIDYDDNREGDEARWAEWAWTALRDVAKYGDAAGDDWSKYAIPSGDTQDLAYLRSMLWFLRHKNQPIKLLVLEVIHNVLRITSTDPLAPEMPRKVRFLRSLIDANGITLIVLATIWYPEGHSWSVVALETIAKQLAQLDKQQQRELSRLRRGN